MKVKVIIDEVELEPDFFVEPKKIEENLEQFRILFPLLVDKIKLLKLNKLNANG